MSKSSKSRLNEFCQKNATLGKPLYTTESVQGGYRSTLKFTNKSDRYVSEICTSKKDAEHSAANVALRSLQPSSQDNTLLQSGSTSTSILQPPNPPRSTTSNLPFPSACSPDLPDLPSLSTHGGPCSMLTRSLNLPTTSTPSPNHPSQDSSQQVMSSVTAHNLSQSHTQFTHPSQLHPQYTHTPTQSHPQHPSQNWPRPQHTLQNQPYPQYMPQNQPHPQHTHQNQLHSQHTPQNQPHTQHTPQNQPHQPYASSPTQSHPSSTSLNQQGDPVALLEELCRRRGWPSPEYQYHEQQGRLVFVSVTTDPSQQPIGINSLGHMDFDLARRAVSEYVLRYMGQGMSSTVDITSRGQETTPSSEVTHPTPEIQDVSTVADKDQEMSSITLVHKLKTMYGENVRIEYNQAVKDGYGKGVVVMITADNNKRFISEVCKDPSEATLDAFKKAVANFEQQSTRDHMDSLTGQSTSPSHPVQPEGTLSAESTKYKNDLQEFTQKRGFPIPSYNTTGNAGNFITTVSFVYGREGQKEKRRDAKMTHSQPTKKKAEQAAAKVALEWLISEGHL